MRSSHLPGEKSDMIVGVVGVVIWTEDLERLVGFYRDTLGQEMYGHYEDVKWAEFNAGNITLSINDPTSFDPSASAQSGGAPVLSGAAAQPSIYTQHICEWELRS